MVFLRATIVRDSALMTEISESKYNFIRADQIRKHEEGLSLMSNENMPILPKWGDSLTLPPSFEDYQESLQKYKGALEKDNRSLDKNSPPPEAIADKPPTVIEGEDPTATEAKD